MINHNVTFSSKNHNRHIIRCTLLFEPPSFLQNSLNSSWHGFNRILGHTDVIPSHSCWWFVSCTSMIWISNSTTSKKVLHWIELWWLWRSFEHTECIAVFKKPFWGDLSFVTCRVILLKADTERWLHCGHKGTDIITNHIQVFKWCSFDTNGPKVCWEIIPHTITSAAAARVWVGVCWGVL